MVTITTITEGLQRYNHHHTIIIISSSWSGNSITHRYAARESESRFGASTGLGNISLARKNAESKVFMGQHQAEPLITRRCRSAVP
jgi:hypothetical protein